MLLRKENILNLEVSQQRGWRGGSVVTSACSGLEFSSERPRWVACSPPITLAPVPSVAHTHVHIQTQQVYKHTKQSENNRAMREEHAIKIQAFLLTSVPSLYF